MKDSIRRLRLCAPWPDTLVWFGIFVPLAVVAGCGPSDSSKGSDGDPVNVVIIALDTLRADVLGCYGARGNPTPSIDAFARDACVFEDATASACWTLPSFASIFTGLYPEAHGATTPISRLPEACVTVAELLKEKGYATAAFTGGGYVTEKCGFRQGFDTFVSRGSLKIEDKLPVARKWIEHVGDNPFFLLVHGYDVHSPYAPENRPAVPSGYSPPDEAVAEALMQSVERREPHSSPPVARAQTAYLTVEPMKGERPLSRFRKAYYEWSRGVTPSVETAWSRAESFSNDLEWVVSNYEAEVGQLDADLTQFLRFLSGEVNRDNTLVIILSDHGEAFMEHKRCEHYHVDQEVARIPLIVRPPARLGTPPPEVDLPVRGIDVFPTVLDYCGVDIPPVCQGRSLRPLLNGEDLPQEAVCCFQNQVPARLDPEISVRLGSWKLTTGGRYSNDPQPLRLYDLSADPGETRDLSAEEPERVVALEKLLSEIRGQCVKIQSLFGDNERTLDRESLRELTELGYLGQIKDE